MSTHQPSFLKWIITDKLAGGAFPLSREIFTLPEIGVALGVNLTSRGISNSVKERLKTSGVKWIRLPIPDFGVPSNNTIERYLQTVCETMQQNQALFTHCIAGCGRTGTMLGLFLVTHGYSPSKALQTIHRALGEGCPETQEQIELIYQYKDKCPNFPSCQGKIPK